MRGLALWARGEQTMVFAWTLARDLAPRSTRRAKQEVRTGHGGSAAGLRGSRKRPHLTDHLLCVTISGVTGELVAQ